MPNEDEVVTSPDEYEKVKEDVKDDPRQPNPAPIQFSSIRAYMKNGSTFKVAFVTVYKALDGWNNYNGVNGLPLCSIRRDEVVAFVNLDVPEETVQGEKGPVKMFPAGMTMSTGYQF